MTANTVVDTDGQILAPAAHDQFFDGRLAVFTTPGIENWFHWLIQALPRLAALKGETFDAIHVPPNLTGPQEQSLQRALDASGLSDKALFRANGRTSAREIVAPEIAWLPCRARPLPSSTLQFVRGLAQIHPSQSRRIYVSRRGYSRLYPNLEWLMALAVDAVDLSTMTFDEQASTFASAELVIATHGSGLTNLVFCSPGTHVVELYNDENFNTVFSRIASAAGCFYRHIDISTLDASTLP